MSAKCQKRTCVAFETVPPGALKFRHLRRLCQRDYAERTAARASMRSCASMPSAIAMTKMITGSDSVARFLYLGAQHSNKPLGCTPRSVAPPDPYQQSQTLDHLLIGGTPP